MLHKKQFEWQKMGLVFQQTDSNWTHSSHPVIIPLPNGEYILGFTSRDKNRRSHIFFSKVEFNGERFSYLTKPKIVIRPGDIGYFDCDGAISVSCVKEKNNWFLYYVGWQNLPREMWICDTGRAKIDLEKIEAYKEFEGPVLGRDKNHPLFAAATAFHIDENGIWHTWYNTGIKWEEKRDGSLKHYYGIYHATSKDGIDWIPDENRAMVLPYKDEYEYAFGRPSVIAKDGFLYMWYAYRATKTIAEYRIGFAYSKDGLKWHRADERSGIDVSKNGWDSQMICYPYLFEHNNEMYMLYNGNNYGQSGIGFAKLKIKQ